MEIVQTKEIMKSKWFRYKTINTFRFEWNSTIILTQTDKKKIEV